MLEGKIRNGDPTLNLVSCGAELDEVVNTVSHIWSRNDIRQVLRK